MDAAAGTDLDFDKLIVEKRTHSAGVVVIEEGHQSRIEGALVAAFLAELPLVVGSARWNQKSQSNLEQVLLQVDLAWTLTLLSLRLLSQMRLSNLCRSSI